MAESQRDTSRDGFRNRLRVYVLTHFRFFWQLVQSIRPLYRWVNRRLIDSAILTTKTRPYPFSTAAPYTTWVSITDRTYNGRHLREVERDDLPDAAAVVELFRRDPENVLISAKSSVLFSYFAQWFTDGFLRTDPRDYRKNTSNHDIDLSPLYGLNEQQTHLLRSHEGGKLKSQMIGDEEFPPFYYHDDGTPRDEFRELPIFHRNLNDEEIPLDQKARLFAMGVERANNHIGYVCFNTLFLREHNRICEQLASAYNWDDERLFQTARMILIVILIRLVIEEYINHITPYHFKFLFETVKNARWYRRNWMTVEFNLLYRWHALTPDTIRYGDRDLQLPETVFNNRLVIEHGIGRIIHDATLQPAGEIGLFNTSHYLLPVEAAGIAQGRRTRLASYNDYRERFSYPRVTAFDQISGNPRVQQGLADLYGSVDKIELFFGLFAEDVRPNSAVGSLIGRMVGVDALSQALTNPLLAENIFHRETFSAVGWELIHSTTRLQQILKRNLPATSPDYEVSLTRLDWQMQ